MKNITISTFTAFLMLTILINGSLAQDMDSLQWKLEKNHNGIKIYTRSVEDYKLKEFKAVTSIEASPEQLADVLRDADNYLEWMSNMEESYVVEMEDDNEVFIYAESKVPWPFSNRDIVTKSVFNEEDGNINVDVTCISDRLPEKKGIVRVPRSRGKWVFNYINQDSTEIIYTYVGDPGGKIPAWVANMFLVDGPYKTLIGLKEYVVKLNGQ